MAVVQKSTEAGETAQLFVQFLSMQQRQALLALGKHPNPPPGAPPANLQLARVLIDQLRAIRDKTRGNLNKDEEHLLGEILSGLELAYIEANKRS